MPKIQTVEDLKRIAVCKHGEDRAWSLAILNGNTNHKKSWQLAIAHPVQSVEEKLTHQIWQQKINSTLGNT